MSSPDPNLLSQLQWWLKLPPTNLIERGDRLRFRHALYLIVHQTAGVLFGMNGLVTPLTFPSTLFDARPGLDALPVTPEACGTRLEKMVVTQEDADGWALASELLREVLSLTGSVGDAVVSPPSVSQPLSSDMLHTIAKEIAGWYRPFPGIDVIALSGSLARGMADEGSDVDLSIYCQSLPSEYERSQMLERMGHMVAPLIEPACDTFWLDGTLIHVRYWRSGDVADMLEALPSVPVDLFLAEDLQLCTPLHDPLHQLSAWQSHLQHFPEPLITSIIQPAQDRLNVFDRLWREAGQRNDLIHRYCLVNQAVNDWLIALFARNNRFLSTPRWVHRELPGFSLLPEDCSGHLNAIIGPLSPEQDDRWERLEMLWTAI